MGAMVGGWRLEGCVGEEEMRGVVDVAGEDMPRESRMVGDEHARLDSTSVEASASVAALLLQWALKGKITRGLRISRQD